MRGARVLGAAGGGDCGSGVRGRGARGNGDRGGGGAELFASTIGGGGSGVAGSWATSASVTSRGAGGGSVSLRDLGLVGWPPGAASRTKPVRTSAAISAAAAGTRPSTVETTGRSSTSGSDAQR